MKSSLSQKIEQVVGELIAEPLGSVPSANGWVGEERRKKEKETKRRENLEERRAEEWGGLRASPRPKLKP